MGSVGDVVVENAKEKVEDSSVEKEEKVGKVEKVEDASVEVTEEKKVEDGCAEVKSEEKKVEDAFVEVNEKPHVQEVEDVAVENTVEDAAVEVMEEPEVQKDEKVSVEVTEEPEVQKDEKVSVEVTEEPDVQKVEDPAVEVTEEPDVQKVEDAAVEVTEEPDVQKVEDASVEVTEEPDVDEVEAMGEPDVEKVTHVGKVEDASVEEQKLCDDEKEDNVAGEPESNAEGTVIPPPRRKLPTLKRFSARRSAGVEGADAGPDAKAPSAIRRQRGAHRVPARVGMGVDDRDTVDYTEPKPEEEGVTRKPALSVAEREQLRLQNIKRNKKIECVERVRGKLVDVTAGLELHTGVFSRVEQQKLVDLVRDLQAKGRRNELKERTYSEPRKWMRGKGRVTLQFGCCYNYAVDKSGNPPGILRDDIVDPIPPLLRTTIKRLVRWHVLPPTCVPDSCIINMYDEGDCIPPHIDHHDFLRPFCTLSLLSECNIVFGANLEVLGPGDFGGSMSLPLPLGSVLVLNGNGADVAKHAVPAVPTERISITFRKMDPAKVPRGFTIDNELQNLRPAVLPPTQPEDS